MLLEYKEYIERALKHCGNTHTFEDVQKGVASGEMQAWQADDNGIVITEIVVHPQKKSLNIFLVGLKKGTGFKQLKKMEKALCLFGKKMGCETMTILGRKGWTKLLPEFGFNIQHFKMERKL
jgi:hypothetical protein